MEVGASAAAAAKMNWARKLVLSVPLRSLEFVLLCP